ncbi:MAG: FtsQ-type POTRA domain-containing protein [Clostridia bacterium]|nr:FtsQ-type POTRA domain-containing protein [Clostridia bacterium]
MKMIRIPRLTKMRSFEEKFPMEGEFFGSREKKKNMSLRRMIQILVGMLGGVVLTGAVLLISGIWQVSEVQVADGQLYTASVVKEYADIHAGDKMLGFDSMAVVKRLKAGLPLLDNIKVRKHLNGRVTISFEEITSVYYTRHNMNYYLISGDDGLSIERGGEVLGVFANANEARRVGAIYVGLPEAARVRVGERLSFINLPYDPDSLSTGAVDYELETDEPKVGYAYVYDFLNNLMESPLAPRVTGMEMGDRYDLHFVLDGRIWVRIGSMEELDRKLDLTNRVLEDRAESGKDDDSLPQLVDVSDPTRIIHRASPDIVLPDWAQNPA